MTKRKKKNTVLKSYTLKLKIKSWSLEGNAKQVFSIKNKLMFWHN